MPKPPKRLRPVKPIPVEPMTPREVEDRGYRIIADLRSCIAEIRSFEEEIRKRGVRPEVFGSLEDEIPF